MYFVTDIPILFNTETGVTFQTIYKSRVLPDGDGLYEVHTNGWPVFLGTVIECHDFIYALAGWVGAVNPMVRPEKDVVLR